MGLLASLESKSKDDIDMIVRDSLKCGQTLHSTYKLKPKEEVGFTVRMKKGQLLVIPAGMVCVVGLTGSEVLRWGFSRH